MLARAAASQSRCLGQRSIATSVVRLGGGPDKFVGGTLPRDKRSGRWYLRPGDGQRKIAPIDKNTPHSGTFMGYGGSACMNYHLVDHLDNSPPFYVFEENGKTYIKPPPQKKLEDLYWEPDYQGIFPYWSRYKMHMKGNYRLSMKAEFLAFYIPTIIIFGLVMPIMMTIYAQDEAIYTTMTVKVIGRQWYWLYEVESPVDDEEEDDD